MQSGCSDCLLTGKLALSLRHLTLGVVLLGAGSHSLPLPQKVSSLEGEAGAPPQCMRQWWICCHGLSGRNVLYPWCGYDGRWWSPLCHALGRSGGRSPFSTRSVTPTFYKNKKKCANRNAYQIIVLMKNFPKINLV
jgi:hypothetical protein